jgi:hypothetical protein
VKTAGKIGVILALALALLFGGSSVALAGTQARPVSGQGTILPGQVLTTPDGHVVMQDGHPVVAPRGMMRPAFAWRIEWWGFAWVKFNETETAGIVQSGIAGAIVYVSQTMPTIPLKMAAGALGAAIWLTAKNALETANERCVMIWVAWFGRGIGRVQC